MVIFLPQMACVCVCVCVMVKGKRTQEKASRQARSKGKPADCYTIRH